MSKLLKELQQALKVAQEKEERFKLTPANIGDISNLTQARLYYEEATGYTNGILECIEIVNIYERNEK